MYRSFRKPSIQFTIWGTKGKIKADKYSLKIFLNEEDTENKLKKGWNTRYITDLAKSVRFYVRGNDFTNQLDYFINCILDGNRNNICNFAEAIKTDIIINEILNNSKKNGLKIEDRLATPLYRENGKSNLKNKKSFKFKFWRTNNA